MAARKPPRRTQAARSAATKARLVAAALKVLQHRGYAGFRVEEVARLAKVSPGARSHHYATKEELVLAAIGHVFRQSEDHTAACIAALAPGADLVASLITDAGFFFLGPYFLPSLELLGVGDQSGSFRQTILVLGRAHRAQLERSWRFVLLRHGWTEAQADDALWLCYTVVRGMAVRRFLDEDPVRHNRLEQLHGLMSAIRTRPGG